MNTLKVSLDTNYGTHTQDIAETETTFEITRSFSLYKGTYDFANYADIKSFLDQCVKHSLQGISLKSKT